EGARGLTGEACSQEVLERSHAQRTLVLEIMAMLEIEIAHREGPRLQRHHLVDQAAAKMGIDVDRRDQTQTQQPEHERRRIVPRELVALGEPANVMRGVRIGLTSRQAQLLDGGFVIRGSVEDMRSAVLRSDVGSADGMRTHRTNSCTHTHSNTTMIPARRMAGSAWNCMKATA